MTSQADRWRYAVLWEFLGKAGKGPEFQAIYGAGGEWVRPFRKNPNYIRTDLTESERAIGSFTRVEH